MLNKKLIVATLLLGLFSTGLVAKGVEYEEASKPTITLKKSDLDVLAKAKSKNFKGLSTKEKEQLLKFLEDYTKSAKKEKAAPSKDKKGKAAPSKDKKGKAAPKVGGEKADPKKDKATEKGAKKVKIGKK
jgi:hypothetical protein